MMKAPKFWYKDSMLGNILGPLGYFYGVITSWRLMISHSWKAKVPVVCVGNLVVGGAGKTPTAIAVAQYFMQLDLRPVFLTRGYGGSERGPLLVTPEYKRLNTVGDEATLLASVAPTIVARHRISGCQLAESIGAQVIIMDDGYQDPSIYKDISLLVVDGHDFFGNCHLLPVGPLRETIPKGLARASAIIVVEWRKSALDSAFKHSHYLSFIARQKLPILRAYLAPGKEATSLSGRRIVAFAGISRPLKFFTTLETIGAVLVERFSFPDHKIYTTTEIQLILDRARVLHAVPVTTTKDAARLSPEYRKKVVALTVAITWSDTTVLKDILQPVK